MRICSSWQCASVLVTSGFYCTFYWWPPCIPKISRRKSNELLNGSSSSTANNNGVSLNVDSASTVASAPVKPKLLVITRQPLAQLGLVFDRSFWEVKWTFYFWGILDIKTTSQFHSPIFILFSGGERAWQPVLDADLPTERTLKSRLRIGKREIITSETREIMT